MYNYEIVLGYYECPYIDEFQRVENINANSIEEAVNYAEDHKFQVLKTS